MAKTRKNDHGCISAGLNSTSLTYGNEAKRKSGLEFVPIAASVSPTKMSYSKNERMNALPYREYAYVGHTAVRRAAITVVVTAARDRSTAGRAATTGIATTKNTAASTAFVRNAAVANVAARYNQRGLSRFAASQAV